ncbi:hypothetical protein [Allorhizocola rhizosphaerae]|uniref:hypothetical protein n=1 Tax=Allorhizocola rhizosphaerae TaxID=1872709 RepID=UPI000E3D83CD|nr:hypothetical protein [Allorhizocola rhizosphaerae]
MRPWKAPVETALILLGLFLLAFGQQQQLGGDGLARWNALLQLWQRGEVADTIYSMIGPLFATPLYLLGLGVLQYYNIILFALSIGALYLLLRKHIDRSLLRTFLLLVVAGSMIAPHVRNFYGEVFTMVAVGVGIVALVYRFTKAGWAAVILGAANTPATLIGLGLVSAGESVRFKRLRHLIPVGVGGLIVVLEIWFRRGFDAEYTNNVVIAKTVMPYSGLDGFSYPFFFGLMAILFSFGKGLVFYAPGLLLPVRKRLDAPLFRVYLLWMLFLAGLVLAYASWWSWYGGDYWGPRFFVIAILPASLALAAVLRHPYPSVLGNLGVLAVLLVSVWVGADSLVLGSYFPPECFIGYYQYAYVCHFTLEFSQIWYPMVRPPHLNPGQLAEFAYYGFVLAWLAVPLLARICAQLADRMSKVDVKMWRF